MQFLCLQVLDQVSALPSWRKVIFTSERFVSETSEYVLESGHAFGRPAFHFRLVLYFETSKIPKI